MTTSTAAPRPLSFIDLFCGAGGLSLGFQQAGFKCVSAIDSDETAGDTYRLNFQDRISSERITEYSRLAPADVIIGGPPCQGFSSAGVRRPQDKRNSLVRVFSEVVSRHKPTAFVFENVEGFLTADNGSRVIDLLAPLVQTGYRIHLRKVNAANYGVPQHRKRVIALGGLGWNPTFPQPTHRAFGAPGATNSFGHLPPCPSLADALQGLPQPAAAPPGVPQGHYAREISHLDSKRIDLLQPGQSMKHLPRSLWHASYRRRAFRRVMDGTPTERRGGAPYGLRRLRPDEPSKAITSGAVSEFVHPFDNRFLTLRECARIQTFPDDFIFVGTPNQSLLQIANAVPPLLARAIALALKTDLEMDTTVPTDRAGGLLSFVPTTSSGMSPALQSVCRLVSHRFANLPATQEQVQLWP